MTGGIFISYRRDDAKHAAGRLAEHLGRTFPREQLFIDVDNIEPGLDFVRVLRDQVGRCDVLLAVIGPSWADARDETGQRRLDNPRDFVRIEIESALARDIRVIPVLVDGARMPGEGELPETLHGLVTRNAVRLAHERFGADAEGLTSALKRAVTPAKAGSFESSKPAQQPEKNRSSPPLSPASTLSHQPDSGGTEIGIVLLSLVATIASLVGIVLLLYESYEMVWMGRDPTISGGPGFVLPAAPVAAALAYKMSISSGSTTRGFSPGLLWLAMAATTAAGIVYFFNWSDKVVFSPATFFGRISSSLTQGLFVAALVALFWAVMRIRNRSAVLTTPETTIYGTAIAASAFTLALTFAGMMRWLAIEGLVAGLILAALSTIALLLWWQRRPNR